jgi:hypothetical protein
MRVPAGTARRSRDTGTECYGCSASSFPHRWGRRQEGQRNLLVTAEWIQPYAPQETVCVAAVWVLVLIQYAVFCVAAQ